MSAYGRTHTRTKVKCICPPVSLRSLGGDNYVPAQLNTKAPALRIRRENHYVSASPAWFYVGAHAPSAALCSRAAARDAFN